MNEPPSTTLLEFLGATGAAESVGVDVDRLIDGRLEPRCMSDVHCGTQQEDDESIVDQTEEPEHRP